MSWLIRARRALEPGANATAFTAFTAFTFPKLPRGRTPDIGVSRVQVETRDDEALPRKYSARTERIDGLELSKPRLSRLTNSAMIGDVC
ncbi:hypothetical protein ColLi_05926 [Colletotrichum liriopes]|uniref:Uncharacterized protein n=1 Tax=Colletotrichum liriopes TaxID=708192 RepID=A0AA37GLA4_9PEZI|nr:hypothetical protein ColLi_05926 [Colletotrichum liriopes]